MRRNQKNHSEFPAFITDNNLGKLAKWLRLIGYDTLCWQGKTDQALWEQALHDQRIVLTCKKKQAHYSTEIKTIVIEGRNGEDQLAFLRRTMDLNPADDRLFHICSICNAKLVTAPKETLSDQIPSYILENQEHFYQCPVCLRIYWPGSHVDHIKKILRLRSLKDRL